MNDLNDGVLALLQDIKEMLHGIALLLVGGFLCLIGAVLGDWGLLLMCIGVFVCIAGMESAHRGYHHHEVVEKQD